MDNEKWVSTVANIVGPVDSIIFAHGGDIAGSEDYSADNPKYAYFKSAGYNFYANVDGSVPAWIQIRDSYVRTARIDLDGYRLYQALTGNEKSIADLDALGIHVLEECISHKLVDTSTVFIDATHIKACANNKKFINRAAKEEAMFYEAKLNAEIDKEREESGKKPLKKKEDDDDDGGPKGPEAPGGGEGRTVKESTTDPESGWFHKGEHKQVFAYTAETA